MFLNHAAPSLIFVEAVLTAELAPLLIFVAAELVALLILSAVELVAMPALPPVHVPPSVFP